MDTATTAALAAAAGSTGLAAAWRDDTAATAIEYGLLASLIVIVCIGAFTNYANALNGLFNNWVIPALGAL